MRYGIGDIPSHISVLANWKELRFVSKDSILKKKSLCFAQRTVKLYQFLTKEKQEFVMAKQILRSGTSIGANVAEAIYGSSRKDFVAKLQIARKEAAETLYWLELLASTDYIKEDGYRSLSSDCHELLCMLTSAIKSCCD